MGITEITEGVWLDPGDDGQLPVQVAWIIDAETPEAVESDGSLVYIIGDEVRAVDVHSGEVVWMFPGEGENDPLDGNALPAAGGVIIGLADAETVRFFAPYEYDVELHRRTGALVRFSRNPEGMRPADGRFSALPRYDPTEFRVQPGLKEFVAFRHQGEVAFRVEVGAPFVDEGRALQVGDTLIFMLSSGHVIALKPTT